MPPSRAELAAKHERVRRLAAEGWATARIAKELGMDRRDVRAVRNAAGLPVGPFVQQPLTLEQKWAERTQPVDGGHLEWSGSRAVSGTPIMIYRGRMYTAAAIAFRIHNGTDPIGYAKASCGTAHCVAPEHVDDAARRARDRAALRIVLGTGERPAFCRRAGHDQTVHGRLSPDGVQYCHACNLTTKATARTQRQQETA
jgi:hypothetical protein